MSSYGELIQALGVLRNVKERRHGIKTLASLCANRAFQVRIVQRGGWRSAILPLIISLDEECRKYASLAIANLSTCPAAHQQLKDEEVLRHLVPMLQSEEVEAVVIYVLNALGNFASSEIMWEQLQRMNVTENVLGAMRNMQRDDVKTNALFCISNLTSDPLQRVWMMANHTYEVAWKLLQHPDFQICQYSLAILRGLSVEKSAQDIFPKMGVLPYLIGIFQSNCPMSLKSLTLNVLLHFSFLAANHPALMEASAMSCIEAATRGEGNFEFTPHGVNIIANLCESVDLHDRLVESPLFPALRDHISNDNKEVQQHVIRAFMQLSLSPKYHHVILSTGVVSNVCPIAMTERFTVEMRTNALQLMGAVCATHPTTPTDGDIMDLLFLICNVGEHIEIRRASMLVIANASADKMNEAALLRKPFVEALVIALSKATDAILMDYLCLFFHNITKLDNKAGSMMIHCHYHRHMFAYEKLEALSRASSIYVCDTCRQLAQDSVVRSQLIQEAMLFKTLADAWAALVSDDVLAPHLALMSSAFVYHSDTHTEFVLQGGVRLTMELYSHSKVEHVRLCCLLSLLYLAENRQSQRSIAQERGMQMLLAAAENETHVDLVTNALKALIPFAASDDYRPQLGMDGGIDTFASYLFSSSLELQQLGVHLLQNLLEFRANRRIFLGLSDAKKCEEDYLEPLLKFLPRYVKAQKSVSKKTRSDAKTSQDKDLTAHDPFMVRCAIHSLALLSLEHDEASYTRLIKLQAAHLLYDLFYSEQIDRSSGEAVLLFFANILHGKAETQATILRSLDVIPMLLSARDMDFSPHTNVRCLSACLAMARQKEFRSRVIVHLDLIMANMNMNISSPSRDENFYATAAVHCALLCELTRASPDCHQQLADAGIIEALLMFVTLAGRGLHDEVCVELLLSAVFGISTMVASPTVGDQCMRSMLSPVTRMQLFLGLLRLPAEAINNAFYSGTVGVRTLQRTAVPAITDEEMEVGQVSPHDFLSYCGVPPADFMYRNIIRTLCIAIADPELRHRIQDATSLQNIVPTCVFALKGTNDIYLQVFGYVLVAIFGAEKNLQYGFVNSSAVINELLTCCRRYSDPKTSGMETSVEAQLAKMGGQGGGWSPSSVALNRYLLAMLALTHMADRMRDVYRLDGPEQQNRDEAEEEGEDGDQPDGKLSYSNLRFVARLAAVCLRELNGDALTKTQLTQIQEFTALLRVVVVHNALLTRIEFEEVQKGGEVQPELVGVVAKAMEDQQAVKTGWEMVPELLRQEFKSLRSVQEKSLGLLNVVDWFLAENRSQPLVAALIEYMGSLSFLCPLGIDMPWSAYRLLAHCPEWLQPGLLTLLCNMMSEPSRVGKEDERSIVERSKTDLRLGEVDSDYLFPLLATSTVEIRQRTLGFLANAATHPGLLRFVAGSGVVRIFQPIQDRATFLENFGILIEQLRMLTNITCREDSHEIFGTLGVVQFLRDCLRNSSDLLHAAKPLGDQEEDEELFDECDITFTEDDAPPLGLRIRWEKPPILNEILPDTPAEYFADMLAEGDELIKINGVDVMYKDQEDIAPMFQDRPLNLVFRRRVPKAIAAPAAPALTKTEPSVREFSGLQLAQVQSIRAYGDYDQYLECFNLAVLTIHNLATRGGNHEVLFAEPKILGMLLDAVSSQVISPALRRLIFSCLTCLAQGKDVAGRVFQVMSEYFISCEKADASLQKYIMLVANLYYTGMRPEDIKPDKSMLVFVEQISSGGSASEANRAVAEILHGMAKAPKDLRGDFVSRETLVVASNFIEIIDQWEVQSRAFEAIYFLTLGACNPELWASLDLLPRMARAASRLLHRAIDHDESLRHNAEALWEITLRTCEHCLQWDSLVHEMGKCPEIDRYLILFFMEGDRSRPLMMKVVAHFMEVLIDRSEGTCWGRWKTMSMPDKLIQWFTAQSEIMKGDPGAAAAKQRAMSPLAAEFPVPAGEGVDDMLHMLLSAAKVDATVTGILLSQGVLDVMAQRMIAHAGFYRQNHSESDTEEMLKANVAFRAIAQHLSSCVNDVEGLTALSGMNLEAHLVSLLELPSEAYRIPSLLVLASMCGHKAPCLTLLRSGGFIKVLGAVEVQLESHGSALEAEELEYIACILDKACCHPELANIVVHSLFRLLCLLCVKGMSMQCRLLASRALAHCALVKPDDLHLLTDPTKGLQYLHHVMSVTTCLRKDGFGGEETQQSIDRRTLIERTRHGLEENPQEGQLVDHFSRLVLCEAVTASPAVCRSVFDELDPLGLLQDFGTQLEAAEKRIAASMIPREIELNAGRVLNNLVTMLHVLLCVVFRQGDHKEAGTPAIQMAMARVMGAVGRLALPDPEDPADPAPAALAEILTNDIRVMFYLSALLREVCSRPLRSGFLGMVRVPMFYLALEACVSLAMRRLERVMERKNTKDILVKGGQQQSMETPLAGRVDGFSLAMVFEHVLVCLRHSLVQAMYVKPDQGSSRADPWHWEAQEKMKVHLEAVNWLPEVIKRFFDTRAIKVEAVRYLSAVASFYESPQAQPQDPDYREDEEGEDIIPDDPEEAGTSAYKLIHVYSLANPHVLEILTEVLETDEDPCTLTLTVQAVANLAGYERRRRLGHEPPKEELPIDGLARLVAAAVRTLQLVSAWPPEYFSDILLSGNRLIGQLLCISSNAMTSRLVTTDMFQALTGLYDVFLKDPYKMRGTKEFVMQVQSNMQVLRSYACSGCIAEAALLGEVGGNFKRGSETRRSSDHRIVALNTLGAGLDAPEVINLIVLTAGTLVATGGLARGWRKDSPTDPDLVLTGVFDDTLASFQSILRRTDISGGADWERIELFRFEQLLKDIQSHRRKQSGKVEDEDLLNCLYLITKQGYSYGNQHFPDYMMEIAYGPREDHTTMQDVAAVCFAMVTSQGKLRNGGQINVANVVKDHADFVLSITKVPDPRLQLWHYRLLAQWSKKPHVLKEVSANAASLRFVVDSLLNESLGRYSVVILHNISVLRCATVIKGKGQLAVACEAYRRMVPGSGSGDESNRRVMRKMVMATIRNVLFGVEQLETELDDQDLVAVVDLVTAVEAPDASLYMAMLLHICEGCDIARTSKVLAGHKDLLHFLLKTIYGFTTACQPGAGDVADLAAAQDLYNVVMPLQDPLEEDDHKDTSPRKGTTSPRATSPRSRTSPRATSPAGRSRQTTLGQKGPTSPTQRGLGKRQSLYNQSRRTRTAAATTSDGVQVIQEPGERGKKAAGVSASRLNKEFMYFAGVEILTHATFLEGAGRLPQAEEAAQPAKAGQEGLDAAFGQSPVTGFIRALREQVGLHERKRVVLSDLFMHVSAKFIWHCWSNPMFRPHIDAPINLEALAPLIPFFFEWPNQDVHALMVDIVLYAGLHRYPVVRDYLCEKHLKFPELSAAALGHALVDESSDVTIRQAMQYLSVFAKLLKGRALSQKGLRRMVVSVQTAMLANRPEGLCASLAQKDSALLGEVLEQMMTYWEVGFIKHGMAMMLALTVGSHYKPLVELDYFVLHVLDFAPSLLESEFVLFFPVLCRLASLGGKRIQLPMLQRKLHVRVARILEQATSEVEAEIKSGEEEKLLGVVDGVWAEPKLGPRQRIQWILAFYTMFASAEEEGTNANTHSPDVHFDSFVCVDLLQVLMRILRTEPDAFEASAACFLISCVSYAKTLPSYVPDLLRVSVKAFPSLMGDKALSITASPNAARSLSKRTRSKETAIGAEMHHLRLASTQRTELALRRSFIHLIANAGHLPASSPAITSNSATFRFLSSLSLEHGLYLDAAAPLHTKLYCLAHMVLKTDDYRVLFDSSAMGGSNVFEVLTAAADQVLMEDADEHYDLRVLWAHSVVTIASNEGIKLLGKPAFRLLLRKAIAFAETILHETTCTRGGAELDPKGLGLGFEFMRSMIAALVPLARRVEFKELQQPYIMYILGMISSALLPSLRIQSLNALHDMITKSSCPDVIGALVMETPSVETFKRIVCGGNEEMAGSCIRCVSALAELGGYDVNVHLLQMLEAIISVIGNPSMTATRIMGLGEIFVSFTKMRAFEIIDALMNVKDLTAFLGLARSSQAVRRELVGRWLEGYGSSLYEVDEVLEVFRASTPRGFLHLAARSTLKPEEAQDLRRLVFATIEKRVQEWRGSVSGLRDFLSEPLLSAMVPMCDLQPDLTASLVALFHSFITHEEGFMLDRVWAGNHFAWLCRGMSMRSAAMVAHCDASSALLAAKAAKNWDRHLDLTVTQGMILRLIQRLHTSYSSELCAKAVKTECLVKNWDKYITYYCHYPWPLREQKEVEEATSTTLILAMLLAAKISHEVGEGARSQLVQQGLVGLCFTVLLPTPKVQQDMCAAIGAPAEAQEAATPDGDPEEVLFMPEAKVLAGDIATLMFRLVDSFKLLKAKHFISVALAMFSQLHSWRNIIFEKQGSLSAVESVSLLERCASLYMSLISSLSVEWCVENLGVYQMGVMGPLFLDMWSRHGNPLLRHHSLRLFSSFCQVQTLYIHFLTQEGRADVLRQAVHRIFGAWDVRELRHVVWLLSASLAHALGLPVLPAHITRTVKKALQDEPACAQLSTVADNLGAELANQTASKHMLLSTFLAQMINWCESPGDAYSRSWCLWMVAAVLKYGEVTGAAAIRRAGEGDEQPEEKKKDQQPEQDVDPQVILMLPGLPNEEHLRRRAQFAAEKATVGVVDESAAQSPGGKAKEEEAAYCRTAWLRESPQLPATLAKMAAKCIGSGRKEFSTLGCHMAAACLTELPTAPPHVAEALDGTAIVRCCEAKGERPLNMSAMLLLAIVTSFRVPFKAQNLSESFLKRFFALQRVLLEGISRSGDHSFELLASWLSEQPQGLFLQADLRCLVAFVIGQCVVPPPAAAPTLDVDTASSAGGPAKVLEASSAAPGKSDKPSVADCDPPPALLLDILAQEALREDLRLQQAKGNGVGARGPLFSTMLCNLLYALAVIVPAHPQIAAHSAAVRGAAFSQLIKVQNIVAQAVQPSQLFDPTDGKRAKLFMYVRATACIRQALQSIMGSWLSADFGVRFVVTEEGGKDFIQYCTKHINQVYNSKTALTKVLGTPWERLMLSQGPTTMIAELLLAVCSSDANLKEVSKLGGEAALHNLSRYGEATQVRQQATMLLTKLAVMTQ